MQIDTTRFGPILVEAEDVIHFPQGLWGLESCRDWVLVPDAHNDAVAWMQSVDRPQIAFAVVSPRRFVPDYRMRVARRELEPLKLTRPQAAEVLVVVGKTGSSVTLNLKAPLVINPERRLGRQVITNGQLPVQFQLNSDCPALKKSA